MGGEDYRSAAACCGLAKIHGRRRIIEEPLQAGGCTFGRQRSMGGEDNCGPAIIVAPQPAAASQRSMGGEDYWRAAAGRRLYIWQAKMIA